MMTAIVDKKKRFVNPNDFKEWLVCQPYQEEVESYFGLADERTKYSTIAQKYFETQVVGTIINTCTRQVDLR